MTSLLVFMTGIASPETLLQCSDRLHSPSMTQHQPNNPLHGKTLEMILHHLVDQYGWKELGMRIKIRCFNENPSIPSSLKFLRKTPWARKKVEYLYLESIRGPESENLDRQ